MNLIDSTACKWDQNGLIPAIIQDNQTNQVLMLGYMNAESLDKTLATGNVWFYSRSRQELWEKGATSGNYLHLVDIALDCDKDSILVAVLPEGPTCHTGANSCFSKEAPSTTASALLRLESTIHKRQAQPKGGSYTSYLFNSGMEKILKKIGEESTEVVIAAMSAQRNELIYETADLLYHLNVLLAAADLTWIDIFTELEVRHK